MFVATSQPFEVGGGGWGVGGLLTGIADGFMLAVWIASLFLGAFLTALSLISVGAQTRPKRSLGRV